jgi:hypothetical protein
VPPKRLIQIAKETQQHIEHQGYEKEPDMKAKWPVERCVFFLIGIVRVGVQLGPLATEATNRHIVPAPGDYDDGEIGGMVE